MISAYNFSLVGRDHKKNNMPCHDYSITDEISASWKIAVVADGVGSCKHAEVASKIAVETVVDLVKKQFPAFTAKTEVYTSVILAAMNGAANAIENYVNKNDPGNEMEYQTTLALAIMSKQYLYYGNAGDSGIIGLDDQGLYHILCKKQNDDIGRVFSLPNHRDFEIGFAEFTPAAALCFTDGVLDYIAPLALRDNEYKVDVPFANIFVTYGLGVSSEDEKKEVERCKKRVINYLSSESCEKMTDDLSAAVLVDTNTFLQAEDIKWKKPEIDYYALKWSEVLVYPSERTQISLFMEYIKEKNPEWTDDQVEKMVVKYAGKTLVDLEAETKKGKSNSSSGLKKMNSIDDEMVQTVEEGKMCPTENVDAEDIEDADAEVEDAITPIKDCRGLKGLLFHKRK